MNFVRRRFQFEQLVLRDERQRTLAAIFFMAQTSRRVPESFGDGWILAIHTHSIDQVTVLAAAQHAPLF